MKSQKLFTSTCVLSACLLPLILGSPNAGAAGFIQRTMNCPAQGAPLIPPGSKFTIKDIIVSSDSVTDVTIRFGPPQQILAVLYMSAGQTVVANFQGQVENLDELQGLKADCTNAGRVSITVTGNSSF